jgi:hypothetical protein
VVGAFPIVSGIAVDSSRPTETSARGGRDRRALSGVSAKVNANVADTQTPSQGGRRGSAEHLGAVKTRVTFGSQASLAVPGAQRDAAQADAWTATRW